MVEFAQRAAPKPSVVNPPSPGGDRYEQLRRIGELRQSGVLSEAEFEKEKARILEQP
ncbi:MAG: SHOCT domain-containing protein [Chloroflexi bacterium]|nr:MAG: SHOCT domain-containing protein [Chloroflexota bacterium]